VQEALDMSFPDTEIEIKIMLPVPTRNLCGLFGLADGFGRMNPSRAADGAHENADTETL
jgi:hypothetical protein